MLSVYVVDYDRTFIVLISYVNRERTRHK